MLPGSCATTTAPVPAAASAATARDGLLALRARLHGERRDLLSRLGDLDLDIDRATAAIDALAGEPDR